MYSEALGNGWLDQEQANMIMRHLAVTQAADIPAELLERLLDDVRAYVLEDAE